MDRSGGEKVSQTLDVVAIRTWRRQGGPAAARSTTEAVVFGNVLAAPALPVHPERALIVWAGTAVVARLLVFLFPRRVGVAP
jgi:hypothetical protein